MAVSKDTEKGTWTSQIWVEDWQGKKKHKKKRGFVGKKEALEWERNMLLASKTDMNMKLADFVEVYFRDKDGELKQRTIRKATRKTRYESIGKRGKDYEFDL